MATEPIPATTASPETEARISPLGRLVGVLFSPKATFEDIARKPSWLLPVICIVVISAISAVGINQKVNWRDYISQQIDKSPAAAQLSPEQKEQRVEAGAKFAPYTAYLFGIPAPILGMLVIALVMWGSYNLLAGTDCAGYDRLCTFSCGFAAETLWDVRSRQSRSDQRRRIFARRERQMAGGVRKKPGYLYLVGHPADRHWLCGRASQETERWKVVRHRLRLVGSLDRSARWAGVYFLLIH